MGLNDEFLEMQMPKQNGDGKWFVATVRDAGSFNANYLHLDGRVYDSTTSVGNSGGGYFGSKGVAEYTTLKYYERWNELDDDNEALNETKEDAFNRAMKGI